MNIIGDVAGRFDELIKLVRIIPNEKIILVGDLNDRGKGSNKVIEWAMNTKDVITLHSNHGDMMVDFYDGIKKYHYTDFLRNGGDSTCKSYGVSYKSIPLDNIVEDFKSKVPKEHIEFLRECPLRYEEDSVLVSHAAWDSTLNDFDKIWNRDYPKKINNKIQVFGHNSHWGLTYFDNKINPYAICIDTSKDSILTCYNTNNKQIYQVEYSD